MKNTKLFLIPIFLLIFATMSMAQLSGNDVSVSWGFDETLASFENATNTMVLENGGPTTFVNSLLDFSLILDEGNLDAYRSANLGLGEHQNFSLTVTFNTTQSQTTADYMVVIGGDGAENNDRLIIRYSDASNLNVIWFGGGICQLTFPATYSDGLSHELTIIINSTAPTNLKDVSVYYDGQFQGQILGCTSNNIGASNFIFLSQDGQGVQPSETTIERIIVFPRIITPAEVVETFNGSFATYTGSGVSVVSTSTEVLLNDSTSPIVLIEGETFTASFLEINGSATFTRNGSGISNNSVQDLTQGLYEFSAIITANMSVDGSSSTLTATVLDVTPPNMSIITTNDTTQSFVPIIINVSIQDNSPLTSIILDFNGTLLTGFTNNNSFFWSLEVIPGGQGVFNYFINATDSYGNTQTTETNTITLDSVVPMVTYNTPANDNSSLLNNSNAFDIIGTNLFLTVANLTVFDINNLTIFSDVNVGLMQPSFTFSNAVSTVMVNQTNGTYVTRVCFIDNANLETCEERSYLYSEPFAVDPGISEIDADVARINSFVSGALIVGIIIIILVSITTGIIISTRRKR